MNRNPKQVGSCLEDMRVQVGKCLGGCNQCFYNLCFYEDISLPRLPDPAYCEDKIVRVNAGHDSNIHKRDVIRQAMKYKHFFFNTSIPNFKGFPGPVVFTANRKEEQRCYIPLEFQVSQERKLMFVRLRVSSTNLCSIETWASLWTGARFPVVLTFMRYYEEPPDRVNYEERTHVITKMWCPTREFMASTMSRFKDNPLVYMCGTLDSSLCEDCRNCELFYWLTIKRWAQNGFNVETHKWERTAR